MYYESCAHSVIKNKALVELEVCGKKHTFESNEVTAKKLKLLIAKEESCPYVFEGDDLEYTIKLFNDSCVNLHGVEFKDPIPKHTKYEANSFKVNGECVKPEILNNVLCYKIPELKAFEDLQICYKVKVY